MSLTQQPDGVVPRRLGPTSSLPEGLRVQARRSRASRGTQMEARIRSAYPHNFIRPPRPSIGPRAAVVLTSQSPSVSRGGSGYTVIRIATHRSGLISKLSRRDRTRTALRRRPRRPQPQRSSSATLPWATGRTIAPGSTRPVPTQSRFPRRPDITPRPPPETDAECGGFSHRRPFVGRFLGSARSRRPA